jgi:hypothetical protein
MIPAPSSPFVGHGSAPTPGRLGSQARLVAVRLRLWEWPRGKSSDVDHVPAAPVTPAPVYFGLIVVPALRQLFVRLLPKLLQLVKPASDVCHVVNMVCTAARAIGLLDPSFQPAPLKTAAASSWPQDRTMVCSANFGESVMRPIVAVITPGNMGAAVGQRLTERGARVVTVLKGRSADTVARAKAAGLVQVDATALAEVDFVLSIVPPG